MAANYSERVYKISVDGAQAIKSLEKISGSASSIDQKISKFGSSLKSMFAGAAVVGAIQQVTNALTSMTSAAINNMDELSKQSQILGITTEKLSELGYAAKLSGSSQADLIAALPRLAKGLTDAAQGTGEALEGFKALNLDPKGFKGTDDALLKIADKFSQFADGTEKTALAINIFGKSGASLIPLLNEGAAGIEKLREEARRLGVVIGSDAAKAAEEYKDNIDRLKSVSEGLAISLASKTLPALNSFLEKVLEISKEMGKTNWSSFMPNSTILGAGSIQEANENVTRLRNTVVEMQAKIAETGGGIWASKTLEEQLMLLKQNEEVLMRMINQTPIQLGEEFDYRTPSLLSAAPRVSDGAKASKSAFDSWIDSIKKAGEEADLIPRKFEYLSAEMAKLTAAGQEGSSAFKVLSDAYAKLNEETAKGNVGATIELQVQKLKDEATLTAEKIQYLGTAIERAFEQSDVEGAQIMVKMMQDLQGETKKAATDFEKMGEGIADAIDKNANNAVNKFIDNIGTAQMSFTDFATSVVKDISKMIVQLLIMKPIMESIKGLFSGWTSGGEVGWETSFNAQGNAFSGGTGLPQGIYNQPTFFKFAKGGTFGANLGVLGEGAGPEAIIPLRRTASGDLGVQGSPVNINVYNNAGVEVETQTSTSGDGTKQIDVYIEKKVREGISGGAFDRVFRGAYGLSRVGA